MTDIALPRPGRIPVTAALADTLVIARRHLIRLARTPQLAVSALVVPVMFLLMFRYIFGGAIPVPAMSYVDYLMPALFAQNAIFDGFATAAAFAVDARDGVVDRFRALPMARSAVLTGRALADLLRQATVLAILVGVAVAVGFRFHAGAPAALAGLGLALLLGQVLFWVFAAIGFGTANPETAAAVTTPFMLLVFVSSAFIPVGTLPSWLQPVARNQPVSQFIDAVRCLTQGASAERLLGHGAGYYVMTSLLWGAGITAVGAVLALRAYRRL
jgi:ABC-2 type transport system permease protein/oleandomycin transport system permease protein